MPLNIGATGSIEPYVKFNAKADKWFAKGETGDVEIGRPTFIADLPNIATGWLRFLEGQAPERVMDTSLDRAAPSCGSAWKKEPAEGVIGVQSGPPSAKGSSECSRESREPGSGCWSWRRSRRYVAGTSCKARPIKAISRELKVSRKVVRKVIRSGETAFAYERRVQPQPKLGPWREELERLLAANAARASLERLTLMRLFEELRGSAMPAAMMRCGATRPDGGAGRMQPRRRPSCR